MENCCCSNSSNNRNKNIVCPVCSKEGQKVNSSTVQNMIINKVSFMEGNTYFICLTSNCKVAYYDNQDNTICISNMKVPIWYKEGASPKYACYCSKVTQEDVIKAVLEQGARDVKTVVEVTGAMKNSNCRINNPTGQCCHSEIQKIINEVTLNNK